jgi:glycosyltransferase involved in cell wall biosynthesis
MHIAIDIRSVLDVHQTGVGQCTRGLLQSLLAHSADHTYTFFYNAAKAVVVPSYIPKENIVATRFPNKFMTVWSPFLHRPYIDDIVKKQKKADLFFSPNIQYLPLRDTPRVVMVHDLSFLHFPEYFSRKGRIWHQLQRVERQLLDARAIVVPSQSTKDDVVHSFNIVEKKVHVITPGIDASYARDVTKKERDAVIKRYDLPERFFFFLGTIEPRKNLLTLIRAYRHSTLFDQHIELVLAGAKGWNDTEIYQAIAQTPGVRYIGYVKEEEKAPLYHLAKTFVFPSLYEGFGFPVLEAMAQGTPVITSNRTSLVEVTNGQVTYVHPHRVDEIVRALEKHVSKPKEQYGVTETNSWDGTAKQLIQVCNSVA